MSKKAEILISGQILEEEIELTVDELSRACSVQAQRIMELVEEGLIDPTGPDPRQWRFAGLSLRRAGTALRLERDLGVNLAGAALALELLDEIERLRARLRLLGER
ncbi:MAG: chaperone modulator CbpM [Gammaproteobacteria bacterium]